MPSVNTSVLATGWAFMLLWMVASRADTENVWLSVGTMVMVLQACSFIDTLHIYTVSLPRPRPPSPISLPPSDL